MFFLKFTYKYMGKKRWRPKKAKEKSRKRGDGPYCFICIYIHFFLNLHINTWGKKKGGGWI